MWHSCGPSLCPYWDCWAVRDAWFSTTTGNSRLQSSSCTELGVAAAKLPLPLMLVHLATTSMFPVHSRMDLKHAPFTPHLTAYEPGKDTLSRAHLLQNTITWRCDTTKIPYDRSCYSRGAAQRVHQKMEDSAPVPRSGFWELLLTLLLLQPPAGVSGAAARTEL